MKNNEFLLQQTNRTLCENPDIQSVVVSLPTLMVHRGFGGIQDLRDGEAHV